LIDILI